MIVYGASASPFVRKVLVAAAEKGIVFNRFVAPRFFGVEGDAAAADKAERDDFRRCATISSG